MMGIRMKQVTLSLISILCLSACAEVELVSHAAKKIPSPIASSKSEGRFKVGSSYKIAGKYYKPQETYNFEETGVASWYGPNFHGKLTANGETFNMYDMTAAHRTLQMPSIIKVTNLDNGRSAIFRVNDRGPFSKKRVLDVSKKGAEVLGFKNQGTARVKIQVLPQESQHVATLAKRGESTRGVELQVAQNMSPYRAAPKPVERALGTIPAQNAPAAVASAEGVYVQAGAFKDAANAQKMVDALKAFGDAHIKPKLAGDNSLYRVRFGPMKVADADMLVDRLGTARRIDAIAVSE